MSKSIIISVLFFLSITTTGLFAQDDIKVLINKRDSSYSVFQKNKSTIEVDSISSKLSKQIKSMNEIIEEDNLIIDLINEKLDQFSSDTSVTNKKNREIEGLTKELDNKNNAFGIFLVLSVVMGGLMVLFILLFINSSISKRKYITNNANSDELAKKYLEERDILLSNINENDNSLNNEYATLKEISDKELKKQKEIQEALKKEIERLNTEFFKAEAIAHNSKVENANLQNEIDDLRDMLKQLSNVPREKIEEMELNFLKLEKLSQLLENKAINEEEFENKKKDLLNEI
ncbi:MAG: hypothetical protein WCK02_00420 [Bacteroidota bacterium]